MPVPSDFDMRRPSGAWITEWMLTLANGTSPVSSVRTSPSGDPEEDDVARRGVDVGRVERAQLQGLFGQPTSRTATARTRTRCRARRGRAPAVAGGRVDAHVGLVAAVPDRQLMAPPELARDAPGPDVLEPVQVDLALLLGVEADPAVASRPRSPAAPARSCRRTTAARSAARCAGPSGASGARRGRRPRSRRSAPRCAARHHRRPGLVGLHAAEALRAASVMRPSSPITLTSSSPCLRAISKSAASCPGVILGAGAELGVDVLVGDDRQPAAHQRQDRRLADRPR